MRPLEQHQFSDCFGAFPFPVLVMTGAGETVYENAAYRSRFRAATDGHELSVALLGGRTSAIRAALAGAPRIVPLGPIAGAAFDAHFFAIGDSPSAAAFIGVAIVERANGASVAAPVRVTHSSEEASHASSVEQHLRFILDGMPQLVWSTRPDGYHDFYNRRWYEYTGAPPDITRGAGWNDPLHPDDQQRAWERWQHSLRTGEDYEIEYRFRRADGEYRWFLGRALPMRDRDGRLVRWFGTCTDVDDQKRLAEQRAEVLAQAEANSRMKDEFLATVSHELRTPLTAILGWARMQRARPELAPKAMEVIERNAEAQAKLIEEILETSRIVTGKLRLYLRHADPNAIVQASVDAIRPAADAKGVTLDFAADPRVPAIVCDPDRLQQVMVNLLVNAVKFTNGGGSVMVRTTAEGPDEIGVCVADTGKGISAGFLPHVFERFQQAGGTTTREAGGLGLGLAIVKHLVELHGGAILAASGGEGKGATFSVRLPLEPASSSPFESVSAACDSAPASSQRHARLDGFRVLIVDDEPDTRDLVAMLLREAGADTREASSASSALAAMGGAPIDVLVSDIRMPFQDGYALLRQLRARSPDRGGSVPAIALTAFTRHEDVARARDAGFQLHLPKPVDPVDLVAAVHHLARRRGSVSMT